MTTAVDSEAAGPAGAAPPGRLRRALRRQVDTMLVFDPSLGQLQIAFAVAAGIGLCVLSGYLFEQITHAMWLKAPAGVKLPSAKELELHAQHHGITLTAMLLSAPLAFISALAVPNGRRKPTIALMLALPIPLLATFAASSALEGDRALAYAVLALSMGLSAYAARFVPRFGPKAIAIGQVLAIGSLMGYLSTGLRPRDLGWVTAWLYCGAIACTLLKVFVSIPLSRGSMQRTVRAVFARARTVFASAEQALGASDERSRRRAQARLQRRLTRLNEAALIADGLLDEYPEVADDVHERLYETELIAQNIGRLAGELANAGLPANVRAEIASQLAEIRQPHREPRLDELDLLRAHAADERLVSADPMAAKRLIRLADLFTQWDRAVARWGEIEPAAEVVEPYRSPVILLAGMLPGAAIVGANAASAQGTLGARLRLSAPMQSAIRLAVAVASAAVVGTVLNTHRFYWAVIAVFVAYAGTPTQGHQLTKAAARIAGTVLGILIGGLLAHLVGYSTWSVAVVMFAFGAGVYFIRTNYALMVIGVTIAVSQLYEQLGEYSNHLLVIRLEETAVGAGIAALVALTILPVNTRRSARLAASAYFTRLGEVLDGLLGRTGADALDTAGGAVALRQSSRGLEAADEQLRAAAAPLARSPLRRRDVERNERLFTEAAYYARNAIAELDGTLVLGEGSRSALSAALRAQRRAVSDLNDGSARDAVEMRRTSDELNAAFADESASARLVAANVSRLSSTLSELVDNLAGIPIAHG